MINIILLIVLGSGFAYASKFNSMLVTVYMGPYTVSSVPLFYVIVGKYVGGSDICFFGANEEFIKERMLGDDVVAGFAAGIASAGVYQLLLKFVL
jgi:hypothetical protein